MTELTLEQARILIAAARAHARAQGFRPLGILVVDAGGHPLAFEREDGASPGRYAIAEAKARGSVMLGLAGRQQAAMAEARPVFMAALNGAFDGRLLPVPGGVLLRDAGGRVVGAVGVTGDTSDNDAAAALAGAQAAGLTGEA